MKNVFFVLICLSGVLFSDQLSGQTTPREDVIYLSDGSVFRGKIIEQYPDSIVKIRIVGSNIIVIPSDKIDSVTIENIYTDIYYTVKIRQRGYYNVTHIGALIGSGFYNDISVGPMFESVNGFQFSPHLQTGIATAFEFVNINMLNICADGRWNFTETRTTAFVYANSGINFPLFQKEESEWMIRTTKPGVSLASGIGMRVNPHLGGLAFIMSLGYKMNAYTIIDDNLISETRTENKYNLNRFVFKIGFAY
ncbi:MAG: hypothetical protein H7X71_01150 [Chitinophagales bacterium]|nr:hypothetical protein [Chitinophagales bacterium]